MWREPPINTIYGGAPLVWRLAEGIDEKVADLLWTCRASACRATAAASGWSGAGGRGARADQINRLFAVGIGDVGFGAFLEQIPHEVRLAALRCDVKGRHTFVRRGSPRDAHRVGFRAGDLRIHVG